TIAAILAGTECTARGPGIGCGRAEPSAGRSPAPPTHSNPHAIWLKRFKEYSGILTGFLAETFSPSAQSVGTHVRPCGHRWAGPKKEEVRKSRLKISNSN